jgi:hypothetical protein
MVRKFLFLGISIIIHILATVFTYNKGESLRKIDKTNYYDIIQHSFPDYSQYHHIKNAVTLAIILPFIFFYNSRKLVSIFNDLLTILPIIIITRSILTSVTILPSVRESHIPKTHHFLDYFIGDNHDRMFSGHVSLVFLLSYMLIKWNYIPFGFGGLVVYNIIHAFIVIVTRSHYTIDILNSLLITYSFSKIIL